LGALLSKVALRFGPLFGYLQLGSTLGRIEEKRTDRKYKRDHEQFQNVPKGLAAYELLTRCGSRPSVISEP
jgi:hypothetical protein